MKSQKQVIGLVGGIASGKSLVARILSELGAGVIDSDQLGREVLEQPDVQRTIQGWWGATLYDRAGRCDRKKLADLVFDDPQKRKQLESLTHPRIEQLRINHMQAHQDNPDVETIVLDSPLLFEAGLDSVCDKIIFVQADPARRTDRSRRDRGWDSAELGRREKSQIDLDLKRRRSDYIVDNNSDIDTLRQHVKDLYLLVRSRVDQKTTGSDVRQPNP